MAKRTRAPARRGRANQSTRRGRAGKSTQRRTASKTPRRRKLPSRRVPAHRTYTPELLANGRRRYEETDESVAAIAADFGIHHYSLIRLAKREGWVRFERPRRALPAAARLLAEAERLEAAHTGAANSACSLAPKGGANLGAPAVVTGSEGSPPVGETVERLYRAVLAELATVEAMRQELGRLPRRPLEASRTAQTLATLTETLQKLQRLRCALPPSELDDDDDLPADIDDFRRDLARRIDAFVASRTESRDAERDCPAPPLDAV